MVDPVKEAAVPEVKPGDNQGAAAPETQGEQKEVPLAALQEERNKRQSVEAKLNQLQAIFGSQIAYDAAGNIIPVTPQQQPNAAPQTPQQQQWGDVRKQLDQLWENDPRKAVQSELAMAINWYDSVNVSVEEEMDKAGEKYKDFQSFRPQVRQYLRKLPLDQRGRPGIVEAAYFLQKGQNFDAALSREQQLMADRIRAGESVQGIGSGSAYTPQGEGRRWTQDEVNVAKMYGQTPEQYFGGKK